MSALQLTAITLCFTIPLLGWALLFRQAFRFAKVFRMGAPDPTRTDRPLRRSWTVLMEFLGHTRMARLPLVAIAHWFTALGFLILFSTLANAFFQLIWADFRLPIIGHFPPFEWLVEIFAVVGFVGIIVLIVIRQRNHPRSAEGVGGRRSRFFGSNWWQAYYVEATILAVMLLIILLRTLEARMVQIENPEESIVLHFPLTGWGAAVWGYMTLPQVKEAIYVFAMLKILISFAWMITVSLQPTMGVAWHRFLAFVNIWFKREASGRTALGALRPLMSGGKPMTMADIESMGDTESDGDSDAGEPTLGVGKVEDFTWKGLLDFTSCTECGRCQSQCPAWNTDKPLSPKLLVMTLRDHAHAKAPWVLASEDERHTLPKHTKRLAEVPLIGSTGYELNYPQGAYDALGPDAVIDEDVLWSCTSCGACVEQCPVDIEHVDAIVDMRRHRVLIESAFPAELGGLFKNMESKSNPWGMAPKARLDWAKGLPFDIPVVGADVESLSEVDYLFWVGCAGAYEDRAKKTTRAVAELLHTAGVSFAVLGEGEACTGDSARRAGNEILFQMLAAQNVEVLNEAGAKKVVVTCAHCFNTLKNEYPSAGGSYEVVHHTQLLNRLVREKRLVPVARPDAASSADVASTAPTVTYHDPCYLGRHNHVYAPPRELIGTLPGVRLVEMARTKERSFCCGAGGARMWMEEKLGTRINVNRTAEAVATGADRIAIGCPFCRVMLSDGLTSAQADGTARADVEVVDIAQMLLAAVRTPVAPPARVPATTPTPVAAPTVTAPTVTAPTVTAPVVTAPAATAPPAEAPVAAEPVAVAPAAPAVVPAPAAEAPPAVAPAAPAVVPAPAEPIAAAPVAKAPVVDLTTMTATEALAAMLAQAGGQPEAPAAPVTAVTPVTPEAPPATPPVSASTSPAAGVTPLTGSMTATEALAAMLAGAADRTASPTPTAAPQPAAAPKPEPGQVAASAPAVAHGSPGGGAAALATLVAMGAERGIIPASEALAILGASPAPASVAPAQPEPPAPTPAAAAPAAQPVAATAPVAPVAPASPVAPVAPAGPAAGAAPVASVPPSAPVAAAARVAPVTPVPPIPPVPTAAPAAVAPSGTSGMAAVLAALGSRKSMPASEALALMRSGDLAPAADAPTPAVVPVPAAAPQAPAPQAPAAPPPQPPAPAAQTPAAPPPQPPAPPAPAPQAVALPAVVPGAWELVLSARGDRASMPASEVLRILTGQDG